MKHALILDLDNTIYPVSSIADNLFRQLFTMLDNDAEGVSYDVIDEAKYELTRMPYHIVADKFNFSAALKSKGIDLLKNITYNLPMRPYDEYHHIQTTSIRKFLVTTGFTNLQWSKVKMLDIEDDFEEIHIVDPEISKLTKKDVFADIMNRYNYRTEDVLVIGDDPQSEIKAAKELGIETFLFDPENKYADDQATYKARNLREIIKMIS